MATSQGPEGPSAGDEIQAHVHGGAPAAGPEFVASVADLHGDRATLDTAQADKQPDWSLTGGGPASHRPTD